MLKWISATRVPAMLLAVLALAPEPAAAQSPLDKINRALGRVKAEQAKAKAARDSINALANGGSPASPNAPPPRDSAAKPGDAGRVPAVAVAPGQGAAVRQGTAKVEEQIVAPNEQDMAYYISPRGVHLMAITQKGSRFVVVHDGVEGSKFDQILNNGSGGFVNFSPDGRRFGYGARLGLEYVVVVDGKEVGRGPVPGVGKQLMFSGVLFSPNSQHWFYHYDVNGRSPRDPDPPPRWYWDGVAGPVGGERNIAVSPDGDHHAYIATTPATTQWALIVDGKPAGYVGSDPQFSADGKHLFTTRTIPVAQGRPAMEVLMDGRPMLRAEIATLHLPPAGDQVITQVQRSDPAGGYSTNFLVIGGKKVVGSEQQGAYGPFWFSADGKHYAARSGSAPKQTLLVDGRRTPDYASIDSVWFTDRGTVVYRARSGAKLFTVTGDQESDGGSYTPQMGRGNRVGYVSADQTSNFVVVDGKVTRLPGRAEVSDLSFSPDGTRFAYFQGPLGGGGGNVLIDHVAGQPSALQPFGQLQAGWPIHYVWSPDSKYTVHYGSPGDKGYTGDYGFFIGDRYISRGKVLNVMAPTFTPDSHHLFWLVGVGERSAMEVWLDGGKVYEFDIQGRGPLNAPGNWEMGVDGVLTFIVQTVDGFKRIRVTPGPENGFEAFLAKGKPARP